MLLQRSLLPQQLVNVAGVSAAARYMPATYEVGGDWYDFFALPAAGSGSRSATWSATGSGRRH